VILMRMGDQNGVNWRRDIERFRQQAGRAPRRIQRPADIEYDAMPIRCGNLDAVAADFVRGAVYG
jgi:hypothetical protein